MIVSEEQLYEQIAQYMNLRHPDVLYRFDLGGLWTPSHRLRNLYGRLNKRAWPDLFVAAPRGWNAAVGWQAGLFLELKRPGCKLKKQDGAWINPHVAEQAEVLDALKDQGYIAEFACGFEEATLIIDSYLNKPEQDGDVSDPEVQF
jgi:hypothetical protein